MADDAVKTDAATTTATDAAATTAATDAGKATTTTTDAGATTDAGKATETDSTAKPEATKEAKAAAEAAAQPIDYDKVLAEVPLPEGMVLDPNATKAGTEVFAKHKLSPEAVKDLATLYAQQQKAGAEGNAKAFATQVDGWKAAAEKATTPEERGAAKEAAIKVFGTEEMALLDTFGVTNRPGFIKALAKLSTAIKDDSYVAGNAAVANGSGDARTLYPKSNMNP